MLTAVLREINWISILVGTIGYFMLGAIWYSFLFKEKWMSYNNIKIEDTANKTGVGGIMFTSFVLMFITSIGLAMLAEYMQLDGWKYGVKLGLLTGICFAFTSMAINMLYEKRPGGLYLINGGYLILGNIISAVIICGWR